MLVPFKGGVLSTQRYQPNLDCHLTPLRHFRLNPSTHKGHSGKRGVNNDLRRSAYLGLPDHGYFNLHSEKTLVQLTVEMRS